MALRTQAIRKHPENSGVHGDGHRFGITPKEKAAWLMSDFASWLTNRSKNLHSTH
jgi:hypothetical protein